jgi:hypothetical protein
MGVFGVRNMAKSKRFTFFGGEYETYRARNQTEARIQADEYATKQLRHYQKSVRVFTLDGYVAVMAPYDCCNWRLWFVSPRGNEMAHSLAMGGTKNEEEGLWNSHLRHFREWVVEESANPRDPAPRLVDCIGVWLPAPSSGNGYGARLPGGVGINGVWKMQQILEHKPIDEQIEYVASERFAWPGGYALGLLMDGGECVCAACVKKEKTRIVESTNGNDQDGWTARCAYVTDADDDGFDDEPATLCAHCGRPITDATEQK